MRRSSARRAAPLLDPLGQILRAGALVGAQRLQPALLAARRQLGDVRAQLFEALALAIARVAAAPAHASSPPESFSLRSSARMRRSRSGRRDSAAISRW